MLEEDGFRLGRNDKKDDPSTNICQTEEADLQACRKVPSGDAEVIAVLSERPDVCKALCTSIATAVGGTALSPSELVGEACEKEGEEAAALRSLLRTGKIIPMSTQIQILTSAMASSPAPHVLADFPRTLSQLGALHARGIEVKLAIKHGAPRVNAGLLKRLDVTEVNSDTSDGSDAQLRAIQAARAALTGCASAETFAATQENGANEKGRSMPTGTDSKQGREMIGNAVPRETLASATSCALKGELQSALHVPAAAQQDGMRALAELQSTIAATPAASQTIVDGR
eukprot:3363275-Pleurochrysis_carterae.AAC.1